VKTTQKPLIILPVDSMEDSVLTASTQKKTNNGDQL